MPSVIDPILAGRETGEVIYSLRLAKADGTPGEVEVPPTFTLEPAELGTVVVVPATEAGVFTAKVRHNGGVGQAVLTAGQVDGDLGPGVHPIGPFTDTVEFRGELGAESATLSAGTQTAPTI